MNLNRRKFLKLGGFSLASMALSGCVSNGKIGVDNILSLENKDERHIQNIKEDMGNYRGSRGIEADKKDARILKNIKHKELYGYKLPKNITGTFIENGLKGVYPEIIEDKTPKIIIENYKGKTVLRFYIGGKLEVVWYVSIGSNRSGRRTSRGNFINKGKLDKYHTSSNKEYRGAVMPYAIHVVGGIWIHGSTGIINGYPRSHGCVRTPLFPVKHIYDKLKEYGSTYIGISISNNIY